VKEIHILQLTVKNISRVSERTETTPRHRAHSVQQCSMHRVTHRYRGSTHRKHCPQYQRRIDGNESV
jgi:hypothetical protein